MGRDNHPRIRQVRHLERKKAKTQQYERALIISEGERTEPNYLGDIRKYFRIPTANIVILPSQLGTCPKHVVESAKDIFLNGDPHRRIQPRDFDKVFVIFDRDDHEHYHDALDLIKSLCDTPLKNRDGKAVAFQAIVSVPCFELWLLLHFKPVHHPITRKEVIKELKKYIPEYEKGKVGYFEVTRLSLPTAHKNADTLCKNTTAYDGTMPYTNFGDIVRYLMDIKS